MRKILQEGLNIWLKGWCLEVIVMIIVKGQSLFSGILFQLLF